METADQHKCPECGGEHMSWRVHRTATRNQRYSSKELHWLCRDCGHQRTEGMSDGKQDST
jgi:predicted RNA-binding Zn-ribbon protein involved in translation (DUF1610 family)